MYARLALIALALTATQADALPHLVPTNATYSSSGKVNFHSSIRNASENDLCTATSGAFSILLGPDTSTKNARVIETKPCPTGDRFAEFLKFYTGNLYVTTKARPSDRYLFLRSYALGISVYEYTPFIPHIECSINWSDVDLGTTHPQNAKVTNSNSTIRCSRDATVLFKLPRPSMEFTEGATSQVSFLPSSGIITVIANRTTPIPLVFDTTVSSSSAAGEYTQNLVVTADYQ
ncbi:hypothetical protein [Yersinia enterocolitica]|uniref:hypothetical protein n=1 Tax=Yersinia enterocolitica TaxID=630 RepID=UPI00094BB86B|nr:hypothetical protein [Yersinia enterocolitica]